MKYFMERLMEVIKNAKSNHELDIIEYEIINSDMIKKYPFLQAKLKKIFSDAKSDSY